MNTEADMNTEANMNTAAEMNADMIGTTDDDSKTETEAAAETETDTEKVCLPLMMLPPSLNFLMLLLWLNWSSLLLSLRSTMWRVSAAITEKDNVACLCCYHGEGQCGVSLLLPEVQPLNLCFSKENFF